MICPKCKEKMICPKCGLPLEVVELEEIGTRDSTKIVLMNVVPIIVLATMIGIITGLYISRSYTLIWMCVAILYGGYVIWYNQSKTMKGTFLLYKKRGEFK